MNIYEQLAQFQGILKAVQENLTQPMEEWERKEYEAIEANCIENIARLTLEIAAYESAYPMVAGEGAGQYTFSVGKDEQLALF